MSEIAMMRSPRTITDEYCPCVYGPCTVVTRCGRDGAGRPVQAPPGRDHDRAMTVVDEILADLKRTFLHAARFQRRQHLHHGQALSHFSLIQAAARAASLKGTVGAGSFLPRCQSVKRITRPSRVSASMPRAIRDSRFGVTPSTPGAALAGG